MIRKVCFPLALHNVDAGINHNWFRSVAQLRQNLRTPFCTGKKNSNQNRPFCPARTRLREMDKGQNPGVSVYILNRLFCDWYWERRRAMGPYISDSAQQEEGLKSLKGFESEFLFCHHFYSLIFMFMPCNHPHECISTENKLTSIACYSHKKLYATLCSPA